jgi:predicted nucleotidyltransferase
MRARPIEPRLCSTREFARLRGVSRQRVLALLDAGRIEGARWIGARWAIPRGARVAPPRRRAAAAAALPQLTPLETALLAEFAARLRPLAGRRLERIAVFGSRARARSRADSDLDVAVLLSGAEDRRLRARIYRAAGEAGAALDGAALLQPAVIFRGSPRTRLADIVEREGLAWTG